MHLRQLESEAQIIQEKLSANRDHRATMMALIASGEAIAFVGAGLSVPLGYRSWPKLLELMESEAAAISPFSVTGATPLLQAQSIKDHFISHDRLSVYHGLLGREFAPRPKLNCTEIHKRLVTLPFRAFVTTNYEDSIETALLQHSEAERLTASPDVIIKAGDDDRHRVSLFLRSLTEPTGQRLVGHLHGRHTDTRSIILSQSDYDFAYGSAQAGHKTTLHRHLVWSLFATRRLVFIGCSMDDPPVRELLGLVATGLWETSTPMHYVILPLDPKSLDKAHSTAAFFKRFGLQVVYYDNLKGDHVFLGSLLDEAVAHAGSSKIVSLPATPAPTLPLPTSPPDTLWLNAVSDDNLSEVKP